MKTLDNAEMNEAIMAVRLLYRIRAIDSFIYEELLAKIIRNTGK